MDFFLSIFVGTFRLLRVFLGGDSVFRLFLFLGIEIDGLVIFFGIFRFEVSFV